MWDSFLQLNKYKPDIKRWLDYIDRSSRQLELPREVDHMRFCLTIMNDHTVDATHGQEQLRHYVNEIEEIFHKYPTPTSFAQTSNSSNGLYDFNPNPLVNEYLNPVKKQDGQWNGVENFDNLFTRRDNSMTTLGGGGEQSLNRTSFGRGIGRGLTVARDIPSTSRSSAEFRQGYIDRKGNRILVKNEDLKHPVKLELPSWLTGIPSDEEAHEVELKFAIFNSTRENEPKLDPEFDKPPHPEGNGGFVGWGRVGGEFKEDVSNLQRTEIKHFFDHRASSSATREEDGSVELLYERRPRNDPRVDVHAPSPRQENVDNFDIQIINYSEEKTYTQSRRSRENDAENNRNLRGQSEGINRQYPFHPPAPSNWMNPIPNWNIHNHKPAPHPPTSATGFNIDEKLELNQNRYYFKHVPATGPPPRFPSFPHIPFPPPPLQQIRPFPSLHQPPPHLHSGGFRGPITPEESADRINCIKEISKLKARQCFAKPLREPSIQLGLQRPQHYLPSRSCPALFKQGIPQPPRQYIAPYQSPPPPPSSHAPQQVPVEAALPTTPRNPRRQVKFNTPLEEERRRKRDEVKNRVRETIEKEKSCNKKVSKMEQIRKQAEKEGLQRLGRSVTKKSSESGTIEETVQNGSVAGPSSNHDNIDTKSQPPRKEKEEENEEQTPMEFCSEENETERKRKSEGAEEKTSSENLETSPLSEPGTPPIINSIPEASTNNSQTEGANISSRPSRTPPPPPQITLIPIPEVENQMDDAFPSTSSAAAVPSTSEAPAEAISPVGVNPEVLADLKPYLRKVMEPEDLERLLANPDSLRYLMLNVKSEFGAEREDQEDLNGLWQNVSGEEMEQVEEEAPPPEEEEVVADEDDREAPRPPSPVPGPSKGRGRRRKTTPKRFGPVTRRQAKMKTNFFKENYSKPSATTELMAKRVTQNKRSLLGPLDIVVHTGFGKVKLEKDVYIPKVKEEPIEDPEPKLDVSIIEIDLSSDDE